MKASRMIICPLCEKPALFLVANLSRLTEAQPEDPDTTSSHYWVKNQLCSCDSISSVIITESNDDLIQEFEYTLAPKIISSQPGSLGVDGRRYP